MVYLYFLDKESKLIYESIPGEISCVAKKRAYFDNINDRNRYPRIVSPKEGEVSDFKGSSLRLWLHENNKAEAYKCFMAYFRNKFEEDMEKMRGLIEEAEEDRYGEEVG